MTSAFGQTGELGHDWLGALGSSGTNCLNGISSGARGAIAAAGTYHGDLLDAQGNLLVEAGEGSGGFVVATSISAMSLQDFAERFYGTVDVEANDVVVEPLVLGGDPLQDYPGVLVAGSYEGGTDEEVFLPSGPYTTPPNGEWHCYLSRVIFNSDFMVPWVVRDIGSSASIAHCCDFSREPFAHTQGKPPTITNVWYAAFAGEYRGALQLSDPSGTVPLPSAAGTDGFISLHNGEDGCSLGAFPIGATDEGESVVIYDIALDENHNLFAVGSFEGEDIDFDPGAGSYEVDSGGGRDAFIVWYRISGNFSLEFKWLWHSDLPGDQVARAVALSPGPRVAVTGWYEDAAQRSDLWIKMIDDPLDGDPTQDWSYTIGGGTPLDYASEGRGIAIDALGRVYVTGYFGRYRNAGDTDDLNCPSCVDYTMDFNPGAGEDWHTTAVGYDSFLTRFKPSGTYDWTTTFGENWNEVGNDVIASHSPNRVIHGGYFGSASAPVNPAYEVDFDPSLFDEALATSRGGQDAYWQVLEAGWGPVDYKISLVVESSDVLLDDCTSTGESLFQAMLDAYASLIEGGSAIPHDGTIALNVVTYGSDNEDDGLAEEVLPFIVIDDGDGASDFAAAVRAIPPIGGLTGIGAGIKESAASFDRTTDLLWNEARVINVMAANPENTGDPADYVYDEAADALDSVDQIDGIAVTSFGLTRDYFLLTQDHDPIIGPPDVGFVRSAADLCPLSLGQPSDFETSQLLKFWCESGQLGCTADIDRDCDVDQSDLGILLSCYELEPLPPGCVDADIDGDDDVDQQDLGILLAQYDNNCD